MTDLAERFWAKVDKNGPVVREELGPCWVWTASVIKTSGYGQIRINRRTFNAHRASWIINVGPVDDGLSVLHKCDNRVCVRPDHLFLGTHIDNMRDAVEKGRMAKGDRHPQRARPEIRNWGDRNGSRTHPERIARKLSDEQVRAIRADNRRQVVIAAEYGVSQALVSAIQLRQARRHVP